MQKRECVHERSQISTSKTYHSIFFIFSFIFLPCLFFQIFIYHQIMWKYNWLKSYSCVFTFNTSAFSSTLWFKLHFYLSPPALIVYYYWQLFSTILNSCSINMQTTKPKCKHTTLLFYVNKRLYVIFLLNHISYHCWCFFFQVKSFGYAETTAKITQNAKVRFKI